MHALGQRLSMRIAALSLALLGTAAAHAAEPVSGWLHWRGPAQGGVSTETDLPDTYTVNGENHRWAIDLKGRGTPVIARYGDKDRLYVWGYRGEGYSMQEVLACVDPANGSILWEHRFNDFLSDIVYDRYSIGAPTVDPATGNVYVMTSPGLLMGFTPDGEMIWQRSMMEEFGRLTFPNGRTGAPAIDGDRVIVNVISSNWGVEGGGRNRFYAFDKATGDLIWSSDPGAGPPFLKDSSFASLWFENRAGMRVFYTATGCGNIVAVNAYTGEPLWRFQVCKGGINATPVVVGDRLITVHGVENIDDSSSGRMIAIDLKKAFDSYAAARRKADFKGPLVLDGSHEVWRNTQIDMFSASPVAADGRIYQVTAHGVLFCVDLESGKTLWTERLGADQLHASPLFADGKLYIPTWHDGFYIIRPTDTGAQILAKVDLNGEECIGSPSVFNGQMYVHTVRHLYCFGAPGKVDIAPPTTGTAEAKPAVRLQVVPAEVLMRPGDKQSFRLRGIDATGGLTAAPEGAPSWQPFVPPTARVQSRMDATFNDAGELVASEDAANSAGAFVVEVGALRGTIRGRVLQSPPYAEDFNGFELSESGADGAYAHPPLPWIGARMKWQVREHEGEKMLVKTLDVPLFQRSMVFLGHPDDRNYTVQADVMTGGNRRMRNDVGVINQRYIITLRGNNNLLEVFSNHDRVKHSVPFRVAPNTWYTLKTRVDVAQDGSGIVRAKVWPRGEAEPEAWTLEMKHAVAHQQGSPGFYALTPQSLFPVYIDNLNVTPNE